MEKRIVHSDGRVLLVGGGACPLEPLRETLPQVRHVVAADGGARHLIENGVFPDLVIGDMDSLEDRLRLALPDDRILHIPEQDSTDFDKALRHIEAPMVLAHGFLGGRLDHQLAALSVLCRYPARRCVLVGAEDVVSLLPPRLALDLPLGMRLSLFPMGAVAGRSEGLQWPIDGLEMAPDAVIGTSNRVVGPVRLEMARPAMLGILPLAAQGALLAGLEAAPGWAGSGF